LFEELKIKLDHLFKRHLTNENLNDVLHKYNQLLANYEGLFDKVKSKVKVRKSKYEGYLQTWREFDLNYKHLDQLFNLNNPDSLTNLEYRSLVIEMSACLGKLKEHHGTLTSIVPERKYFEMKDLIILYGLKLIKFKEDYETKNVIKNTVHNNTSNIASLEDISNDEMYFRLNGCDCEHQDFFDNLTPEVSLKKKKIETSDKSTATINEMGTQTDEVSPKIAEFSSIWPMINEKTIKIRSARNYLTNQKNEHRFNNVVRRTFLKKSNFNKHNRETTVKSYCLRPT